MSLFVIVLFSLLLHKLQSANAKIFEQLIAANESNKDVDIGGISQLVGLQNKKEFENGITGGMV